MSHENLCCFKHVKNSILINFRKLDLSEKIDIKELVINHYLFKTENPNTMLIIYD